MRKSLLLFFICFGSIHLFAQQVVRGPYLQNPTASSIIVRWRTDSPTDSKVVYGVTQQNLTLTKVDTVQTTEHIVTISGLNANAKYYYRIGNNSTLFTPSSEDVYFKTFPPLGTIQPTRIWAIGDFGKANERQKRVRNSFVNYDWERKTDVWLWLGDNAYQDGTDAEYQAKVFDTTFAYGKLFQRLPFHPAPGNHDYNSFSPIFSTSDPLVQSGTYLDVINVPTQAENGGVPSGIKQYYSFNHGGVHFVSINTELASLNNPAHDWLGVGATPDSNFARSPMRKWLEQDLQQNKQRFTIVYFHQVPHTAGSHVSSSPIEIQGGAIRKLWCPLFEKYGVDIVLGGHSHVYERSYLMNGFYGNWNTLDPTMILDSTIGTLASGKPYRKTFHGPQAGKGTVYVVCGNAGSSETNPPFTCPIMLAEDGCDECVGSLVIDVNGDTLTSKYLKGDGSIGDEFSIVKTDFPLAVEKEISQTSMLDVFPNPTSALFTIKLKTNLNATLVLTDLTGRKVWEREVEAMPNEQQVEVNVKEIGLRKGEYLLSQHDASGTVTRKLVIK
ncbi:MAG: metallophosphoesterase [Chitinophagales bacterium]|jgi:hypothetical protein|nr:metallophosphoesterase [Chitinophagales bacterium]